MCGQLLTLPMGTTSSPDLVTRPFGPGMLRLEPQLESLYRGTLVGWSLLLTLLMGRTSSLELLTGPFESGMRRLVPQLASRLGGTPTLCGLLLTRRMVSTLSLDLLTAPSVCGAHFHNPLATFPPLTRCTLISVQSQT